MSRNLIDLHPEVHWRAKRWLEWNEQAGCPVLIYRTLATFPEQQALYEQGRTTPGPPCRHDGKSWPIGTCPKHPLGATITDAQAGESYHNYGAALDGVPLVDGKPDWDDLRKFHVMGELGEDLGFQWGGRWPHRKDYPHLQFTFGFTVHELRTFYEFGGLPRVWAEITVKNEKNKWP